MQGRLLAVGLLGRVDFVYPSGQRSRGSPGKTGETSSPAGGPGSTRGICVGEVVQRPQHGWKKIQTSHFSSQWLESKYLNNRVLFLWWRVKFPQTTLGKHFFILLKWNAWKKHSVKENYSLQVSWAEHTEGVNLEGCCFRRTRSIKHSCFGAPCTFFFKAYWCIQRKKDAAMEVVLCVFVQPTLQAWVLLFSSNSGLWFLAASWAARRESENSTVSVLFQRVTGQNLFGLCQVA